MFFNIFEFCGVNGGFFIVCYFVIIGVDEGMWLVGVFFVWWEGGGLVLCWGLG